MLLTLLQSQPTTQNSFWVKINGVWKQAVSWIKVDGVWKQMTPKLKVAGIWK
jgi:hypothetical protein